MSEREHVVVVGAGVAGLATALALGRTGRPVTLLERDRLPALGDPEEAFATERRGAPQSHQTHGFLARVAVELRSRFPDVLDALHEAGCTELPVNLALGEPQPGDEDLRVLVMRRTTFEWVLRRAVLAEPAVTLRTGVGVVGLTTAGDRPDGRVRVDGVRLDDGTTLPADVVVAATGRRCPAPSWLAEVGVELPEVVHESGLVYMTRWYRLPEGGDLDLDPKLGGDLGYLKYLGVPGDGGTLSITLAVRTTDAPLRGALADPDRFERACRALPGPDQFFTRGPLTPIGGVRPMGGLVNRLRRYAGPDGEPIVLGLHAVGDAHTCTNPLYGRGCALALVQAGLLADAATAHPGDHRGRARAYEAACREHVEPWFDLAVQTDRTGADPTGFSPTGTSPQAKALAALFVAGGSDPVVGRALARLWNLLDRPVDLAARPEVVARMAEVMSNPDDYPPPPSTAPTRAELLEVLGVTEEAATHV